MNFIYFLISDHLIIRLSTQAHHFISTALNTCVVNRGRNYIRKQTHSMIRKFLCLFIWSVASEKKNQWCQSWKTRILRQTHRFPCLFAGSVQVSHYSQDAPYLIRRLTTFFSTLCSLTSAVNKSKPLWGTSLQSICSLLPHKDGTRTTVRVSLRYWNTWLNIVLEELHLLKQFTRSC